MALTRLTRGRAAATAAGFIALAVVAFGCSAPSNSPAPDSRGPESGLPPSVSAPDTTVEVVTVGDIVCAADVDVTETECQQMATADLASSLSPDAVIALGDLQYESGQFDEFQRNWAPGWGRFDDIIAPVPGNHEYQTDGADGYLRYFDTEPYYVRQLGAWRFYLLDSNCDQIDCAQEASWLAADLAANPSACAAIAMHHPRWSSGVEHGSQDQVDELWAAAVDGGVDLSLAGHDHAYERFAPMDAAGNLAERGAGTTHFVVGTGGRSQYDIGDPEPGSEFSADGVFGVLDLTLSPKAFEWRFVDVDGETLDAGAQNCS